MYKGRISFELSRATDGLRGDGCDDKVTVAAPRSSYWDKYLIASTRRVRIPDNWRLKPVKPAYSPIAGGSSIPTLEYV